MSNEKFISRRRAMALLGVGSAVLLDGSMPSLAAEAEALHYLSLEAVARKIQSRAISPVDVTKYMLDRIAKVDPVLKAYATVMADQAMVDARNAARELTGGHYRGPLHGVPVAVKDLCYTKGVRTMGGTAARKNFIPDY